MHELAKGIVIGIICMGLWFAAISRLTVIPKAPWWVFAVLPALLAAMAYSP